MGDHVNYGLLLLIARVVAFVLAIVFAFGAVMYWSTSLPSWNLIGVISLVSLLTFALVPRRHLALPAIRHGIFVLTGVATAANMYGLVHSLNILRLVGWQPVAVQSVVAILFLAMFVEAYVHDRKHAAV